MTSGDYQTHEPEYKAVCARRKTPLTWKKRIARVHAFAVLVSLVAPAALFLVIGNARAVDFHSPPPPNAPPRIVDFMGTEGSGTWDFDGQVIDEHPVGMVVTFGGLLNGHQTTVQNSEGYFSYTAQVQGPGTVTAHTIDDHQQGSNYADFIVP